MDEETGQHGRRLPTAAGLVGCPEGGGDMAGVVLTWSADIDAYLLSGAELINLIQ